MRNYTIFSSIDWNVLSPSPERLTLDTFIFDTLNLTQGERDAVYEAVIELVENRLNKADSLSVSREQRKRIAAVEETLGIWIGLPEPQEPVEEHEESEDEVESFYA